MSYSENSNLDDAPTRTCNDCGYEGPVIEIEQRVDRHDPTNTVVIMEQCSHCGNAL